MDISKTFASMVFNDDSMVERLSPQIYDEFKRSVKSGETFNLKILDSIALAMKEWAIEKGATHFAHWFQPINGLCAEKYDSFVSRKSYNKAIMNFSGKELMKGEPDASSFPSGNLRSSSQARGYTIWDPTSFAFVWNNVLYIPCVFCSYNGEVLDKKTSLLRSIDFINKQALRILRVLGDEKSEKVIPTVGAEQEFFLIDKDLYKKRPDLVLCNRTLIGARSPKGQEFSDHYLRKMNSCVAKFIKELDCELLKLGIFSKTKHNEVAPSQYEVAPLFTCANVASDNNQLMMEVMKSVADKNNMVCLFHEKPFDGINGSGKHNNWSLSTDTGVNLLEYTENSSEKLRFHLFLCAIIKAVDEFQDLLKACISSRTNDLRLGAFEAPPGIISIYLGEELERDLIDFSKNKFVVKDKNKNTKLDMKVPALPVLEKDLLDRNRTSPFVFTGNKFEFRMLGANGSVAATNTILNTIVGHELSEFADTLEKHKKSNDDVVNLISRTVENHSRVIFNGDNYSKEWQYEARRRRLYKFNFATDSLNAFLAQKNLDLFEKHKIYSNIEVKSRHKVLIQKYCKTTLLEAKVLCLMVKRDIIPAVFQYEKTLYQNLLNKEKLLIVDCEENIEKHILEQLSKLTLNAYKSTNTLTELIDKTNVEDLEESATLCNEKIIPTMSILRENVDKIELIMPKKLWPYPSTTDLLFNF